MSQASDALPSPVAAPTEIYPEPKNFLAKIIDGIEAVGNKVPHPAVMFLLLSGVVIVLSHLFYLLGASVSYEAINPQTHQLEQQTVAVRSLLTAEGIRFLLTSPIQNFLNFNAIGIILVVMVGVGLAEEAGLIGALIRQIVAVAPGWAITYILVFLGILSSIASDAGYLVLIPLGAAAYLSLGRHPLAGLAAAFAAVAAAFGVNILITPLDGVLTELTNDAIHLLNPAISIDLTANLYFSIVSTLVFTVVIAVMSDKIIETGLGPYKGDKPLEQSEGVSAQESKGLRAALIATLGTAAVIALLTLPPGAPLRNPETGAIVGNSPFMDSLIILIMLLFLAAGAAYGRAAGTITSLGGAIKAVEKTFAGLGGLVFLFLVISQFLAHFNYTNMATLAAVSLGDALERANIGAIPLLVGFVVVTCVIDVILTGAIPKWAIFAPIFVPLFMRLGIGPEAVLAAYRVGDSPFNAVTPLMGYFGLILVFTQRYKPDAGVGTVVAMMLPYSLVIFLVWTLLLAIWVGVGIPLGPGVPALAR